MAPDLAAGGIYEWTDENGVRHFTDGPPPPDAKIVEGLSEMQPDGAQPPTGGREDMIPGTREGEDAGPADPEDTGGVESGEGGETGREDYWRRRGWENGPTDGENSGAEEGDEGALVDGEAPGVLEDGENSLSEE